MTIFQSKMAFLSANSRFAVQNDRMYLPRITRETCTVNCCYLSNDVIVGILQPLVEGDQAVVILVHVGEVLPSLGQSSLNLSKKAGSGCFSFGSVYKCSSKCFSIHFNIIFMWYRLNRFFILFLKKYFKYNFELQIEFWNE
jgi:hypothetical protein